jgi:hypothetical protein
MANVNLSQRDIDYIARVVDTEVPRSIARKNPAEYQRMVGAVVDTVTNRMASGTFPASAEGVLNQSRQFSKITGPSYLSPYGSVQQTPRAPEEVRNLVSDRIAGAAAGEPSLIGGALNYANPNYSSKSNLRSWINPMIESGAKMLGIGNAVHYHGNAPGQRPVGPYSVSAEGIPSGNVPTPSFRDEQPQSQSAYGLMAAINPATPSPVERGSLLSDPRAAPVSNSLLGYAPTIPDQRMSLPESQPQAVAAFDAGRFGPKPNMQTVPDLKYDRFAATPFDQARFADPTQTATSMNSLRRGLLDQQLDAGELPSLAQPAYAAMAAQTIDPATTAATPGYVDPQVSVQAPAQTRPAMPAAPAQPSPQQMAQAGILAAGPTTPDAALGARVEKQLSNRKLAGTLLGGVLGGGLLGPLGGLVGGYLGRQTAAKTYFPEAPKTDPDKQKSQSKGDGSLTSYGRSVANSSSQFSRAMASGGKGLY